eukprot:5765441-Prymnesium_polylepis.1
MHPPPPPMHPPPPPMHPPPPPMHPPPPPMHPPPATRVRRLGMRAARGVGLGCGVARGVEGVGSHLLPLSARRIGGGGDVVDGEGAL